MNRPAITNQYGEMITGMPNGRATTRPDPRVLCAGLPPGSLRLGSGVVLATALMLRACRLVLVGAAHRVPRSFFRGAAPGPPRLSVGWSTVLLWRRHWFHRMPPRSLRS